MLVIDRFEDSFAVVEEDDSRRFVIERRFLPENAHEGDCIVEKNGSYEVDVEATQKRKEEILSIMRRIKK